MREVLHDDVDVDSGVAERTEDRRCDAGAIRNTQQRDLGHVGLVCDAANLLALFHSWVSADDRSRLLLEAVEDPDFHRVCLSDLDRPRVDDPSARRRKLEHLVVRDLRQHARVGDEVRIRRVDAGDVGEDLTPLGCEGDGKRDRARVGAPTTEGRDVHVLGGALEAGDDDHPPLFKLVEDPLRNDVHDSRGAVRTAGADARLQTGERQRGGACGFEAHGQQRRRDRLSAAEQHVHLAGRRIVGDAVRERDELVGHVSHRADDDDDLCAGTLCVTHAPRDTAQLRRRCHAGAAELLHDAHHACTSTRAP